MRIAYLSANLGDIDLDLQGRHTPQSVEADFFYFTELNYPLRDSAMSPRLQAKIPKMLGWDMVPGYDVYIWADACFTLSSPDAIAWLLTQLGDNDIAFFRHQDRRTSIRDELAFMEDHMEGRSGDGYARDYLNERYATEPMREQLARYLADPEFPDDKLFAAGMFIYRPSGLVKATLKEWYYQCCRWSVQDQISLPYVLEKSGLKVSTIDEGITTNPWTRYWNRRNYNRGKWDGIYKSLTPEPSAFLYGDTQTYEIGAEALKDCEKVEDWGTGAGGFKRYRPDAIGIDGSHTPHADVVADLTAYHSEADGIFLRHVLEHFIRATDWDIIIIDKLTYASFGYDRLKEIGAYDNPRVRHFAYDFTKPIESCLYDELKGANYILHLGAETHVDNSIRDPEPFVQSNVIGTMNVLQFARRLPDLRRMVYFSTDEVFGPADRDQVPDGYKEWHCYNSSNPYAATKAAGEELCLAWANTYKVPVFITHTMNVFGERQHPEKFIPKTIKAVELGEKVMIHADPSRTVSGTRYYIHARNVATALHFLLGQARPRDKYNIVGEKEVSNLDLARAIANIVGKPLDFELVDFHSSRPGHDLRYGLDGTKLKRMGFTFPKTFEESLRKTIEWTLHHRQWLEGEGA